MNGLLWPLALYSAAVLIVVGGMIGLSALLGQRHGEKTTREPYESGIPVTASARQKFPAHYYVVAMLFVIFDVEAAFVIVWAVALRETGWAGYAGALVFLAVLLVGLFYEGKSGAFDIALRGKDVLGELRRRKGSEGRE